MKEIATHSHLGSCSTNKLNKRLIRSSQYLSQSNLDISHRPGKSNIMADDLSHLPTDTPAGEGDILQETVDYDV